VLEFGSGLCDFTIGFYFFHTTFQSTNVCFFSPGGRFNSFAIFVQINDGQTRRTTLITRVFGLPAYGKGEQNTRSGR